MRFFLFPAVAAFAATLPRPAGPKLPGAGVKVLATQAAFRDTMAA